MNDRITAAHLERGAIVYVRQSSPGQVRIHRESTRVQMDLRNRAIELGWPSPTVITDDLGVSAAGFADRAGFQHLVAEVSLGKVGLILCFEASRLSRNSKDWAQLFELCGHLDTLVADVDEVYDLSRPNDRLILGVKGSISEFELSLFRQRSREAIQAKAKRGELRFTLPAGMSWSDGKIELNPDRRVQQAIRLVLEKFAEFGSARQVLMWLSEENLSLPTLVHERPRDVQWRLPCYRTVLAIVRNPFYAGAYVFGRHETRTRLVDGRAKRVPGNSKPISEWTTLIVDHHPGYISWEQFTRNQQVLEENAHKMGTKGRKSGRGGGALLAGLLRCARCGRMLHVVYSMHGYARYQCREANRAHGSPRCIGFSARRSDEAIRAQIIQAVQGYSLQAAIEAGDLVERQNRERQAALELELEQVRYQARLAQRRYEAVDPEQRLVAAELEARWNEALQRVAELKSRQRAREPSAMESAAIDRGTLENLATDLLAVWDAPSSDMRLKQRIARMLIQEIITDVEEAEDGRRHVLLVTHWVGGRHSEQRVVQPRSGEHGHRTDPEADAVVRTMAGAWPDHVIASTLNRLRLLTGAGNTWTASRVLSVRKRLRLVDYNPADDKPMLTLAEAANRLGVGPWVVRRLIQVGVLEATQVVRCAPWQIDPALLASDRVRRAAEDVQARRKLRPRSGDARQATLRIPGT